MFRQKKYSTKGRFLQAGAVRKICLQILPRRDSLVFFEGTDKVADIIEAAGHGSFGDGGAGIDQMITGPLDPVIIHIINGCAPGHFGEKVAEILWRHACCLCQGVQLDFLGIVVFDIIQGIFQQIDIFVAG